jgi:hypothetical protein
LSGENDKICGKQIPLCLGLFIEEKEEGTLRFDNRVTKVQNLHACFFSGGGLQTTTFNAVPGSVLGLRNSAEIGQLLIADRV